MNVKGSAFRREGGFTLIEVMISLVITMTAFLAILSMINAAFRVYARGKRLTIATTLATSKISEFKEQLVADIVSGEDCVDRDGESLASCDVDGDSIVDVGAFERIWTVSDVDADGDGAVDGELVGSLKKISLEVGWTNPRERTEWEFAKKVKISTMTTGKPL